MLLAESRIKRLKSGINMSEPSATEHYWQSPFVDWREELPAGWELFLFYIRTSRQQARIAAIVEALHLLNGLPAVSLVGGPLADRRGVFWIAVPPEAAREAVRRFPRLGYTAAVDRAVPLAAERPTADKSQKVRWRGVAYQLERVYQENPDQILEESPDRRPFLLAKEGKPVLVHGYRGDGRELSRRGLPAPDARLLVNLVATAHPARFLDPFAGIGGILLEAGKHGLTVVSADVDPVLRFGLQAMSGRHSIADAARLPFASEGFEAIATEPPYHPASESFLVEALREMHRVLILGGRLALLCAAWQTDLFRSTGAELRMSTFLDSPINRKGLDVAILGWQK
jgi:hypothetical protein